MEGRLDSISEIYAQKRILVSRTHLFDPGIWINISPKRRYDTCSERTSANIGTTFWVKELNPFDPRLMRFQVFKGKGMREMIPINDS